MAEPSSQLNSKPTGNRWLKPPKQWFVILGFAILFFAIAFPVFRIQQNYAIPSNVFSFTDAGLSDFHTGAYYSSLAFREGVNPYVAEVCDKYPMTRCSPPYSPVIFMLYAPLTYLPLHVADIANVIINTLMIGLIAYFSLMMSGARVHWSYWIWIFGMILLSRPGHMTIYTGYFTAQLVIGTLMAVHFANTRPMLAGIGMMLASGKPTYILPLTILMFCRRNFKAAGYGILFCTIAGVIGLGWLASHSSIGEVIEGVREGQNAHIEDKTEIPKNTWTRIDTVGVVAKIAKQKPGSLFHLGTMLGLLIVPGIAIWKISKVESNRGANGISGMILMLAMLITIYHHSYDCLLMAVAWVGVTFFGKRICPELKSIELYALSFLLGLPALSYFASMRFRDFMGIDNQSTVWNIVTSINGTCLLVALLILLFAAFRTIRHFDRESDIANDFGS